MKDWANDIIKVDSIPWDRRYVAIRSWYAGEKDDTEVLICLTPDKARKLAAKLLNLAAMVEALNA